MTRWGRLTGVMLLGMMVVGGEAAEPEASPTPRVRSFTGGWGASGKVSRLKGLPEEERRKTGELEAKMAVVPLEGITEGADGSNLRWVRVTNPNSDAVFFLCREYQGRAVIQPGWRRWKDGEWMPLVWATCGTGLRERVLEPGESQVIGVSLLGDVGRQRVVGRFYRVDKPSVQSDCELYERR